MKIRAYSLSDGIAGLICVLTLLSLVSVGLVRNRAASRADTCQNQLKKLGLGFQNYHSAFLQLPQGAGGTDSGSDKEPLRGNASRLSALVGLTPFLEEQKLWEQIINPMRSAQGSFPSMGPVPWHDGNEYSPWKECPKVFICPTDPDSNRFSAASSYVVNYGDGILDVGEVPDGRLEESRAVNRGIFHRKVKLRFRDVLDGLSNTAFVSEAKIAGLRVAQGIPGLAMNPSLAIKPADGVTYWPEGRGAIWADGCVRSSGFQTILHPNSPSATADTGEYTAVMSASSHHMGGVHVLMADGAVGFVLDSVDHGDSSSPSVARTSPPQGYASPGAGSPYGVWGALGTRAHREVIDRKKVLMKPRREFSDEEKAGFMLAPSKTWALADASTVEAWRVGLTEDDQVELLKEDGKFVRIPLSSLKSEDAYFAVERESSKKIEQRRLLVDQLNEGVSWLEAKQYTEFASAFMHVDASEDSDPAKAISDIARVRGTLIQQFEDAILRIKYNDWQSLKMDASGSEIILPAGPGKVRLRFADGRWRFAK